MKPKFYIMHLKSHLRILDSIRHSEKYSNLERQTAYSQAELIKMLIKELEETL